jgi:uncharacterized protein (TIGR02996 family)
VLSAEAFLQSILADPDADGPRLVFADWLDEQGHAAWAAFIRAQIALARLHEDDPRRPALAGREEGLLRAIRGPWRRDHAPTAAGPSAAAYNPFATWLAAVGPDFTLHNITFARGMPDGVYVPARLFAEQLDNLLRTWPIRNVWLYGLQGRLVPELADRPWPGRVTGLTVTQTVFRDGNLERFLGSPNLANLRELTVGYNAPVRPEDVAGLVGLSFDRLESLRFTFGSIGIAGAEILAGWPQLSRLTRLDLQGHEIRSAGTTALCASGRLARLTRLTLTRNGITADGASAVARSAFFGGLEVLDLSGNPLGDEGVTQLGFGPRRGRLRRLELARTLCGPAGVRGLVGSADPGSLTELDLSDNRIGLEGAAALAASPALAGLQTLDLAKNRIGTEGTRALAASPHPGKLRSLNLSVNEVGDAGLRALIDSAYLTSLRWLDLRYSGIGDEAARALARWPGLARLQFLRLWQNYIGDAGAEALANSPYTAGVGTLDLSYNHRITERGVAALAAAGLTNVVVQRAT